MLDGVQAGKAAANTCSKNPLHLPPRTDPRRTDAQAGVGDLRQRAAGVSSDRARELNGFADIPASPMMPWRPCRGRKLALLLMIFCAGGPVNILLPPVRQCGRFVRTPCWRVQRQSPAALCWWSARQRPARLQWRRRPAMNGMAQPCGTIGGTLRVLDRIALESAANACAAAAAGWGRQQAALRQPGTSSAWPSAVYRFRELPEAAKAIGENIADLRPRRSVLPSSGKRWRQSQSDNAVQRILRGVKARL